jgi:hypothetical protein
MYFKESVHIYATGKHPVRKILCFWSWYLCNNRFQFGLVLWTGKTAFTELKLIYCHQNNCRIIWFLNFYAHTWRWSCEQICRAWHHTLVEPICVSIGHCTLWKPRNRRAVRRAKFRSRQTATLADLRTCTH